MLTFDIINAPIKQFNLNTFEREQKLYETWKELHDKAKWNAKLKIKTAAGEEFVIDVMRIRRCAFEAVEFVEPEVIGREQSEVKYYGR